MKFNIRSVKFDTNGLVPAIVQDHKDGKVLMLAYMNKESLKRTLKSKKATFWSRSRQKFWVKGETSGNIQKVKDISFDCDGDAILLKVIQVGGAACHTGFRSCFYRSITNKNTVKVCSKRVFDPEKIYKKLK
jgi:phosphoribosyl-AMP cyclohydrolase